MQLGGYFGMVGSFDATHFWLTRLVSQLDAYRTAVLVQLYLQGSTSEAPLPLTPSHPLVSLVRRYQSSVTQLPSTMLEGSTFRMPQAGYQPIIADIGSQRRLRVTKGIYLPADVPMHGIFGSKDVIHS